MKKKYKKIISLLMAFTICLTSGIMPVHAENTPEESATGKYENIALNKAVESDSYDSSLVAQNVVDGNKTTYWNASIDAIPSAENPNWITIDLGGECEINSMEAAIPENWDGRTEKMRILISEDGEEFTELKAAEEYTFNPSVNLNTIKLFEDTDDTDEQVKASYVKLEVQSNTGADSNVAQISELDIQGTMLKERINEPAGEGTQAINPEASDPEAFDLEKYENIALNKAVESDSYDRNKVAENVVDGNKSTYWNASVKAIPSDENPNWIAIDLGGICEINSMEASIPENWGGRTEKMHILVSNDGEDFTELKAAEEYTFNPSANANTVKLFEDTDNTDEPVKASYVKLEVLSNTGADSNVAQISELVIQGTMLRERIDKLAGEGTKASPYLINKEAELYYWAEQLNAGNAVYSDHKVFRITSDIVMTNELPMVTEFNGTFDGAGHALMDMTINGQLPEVNPLNYSCAFILKNNGGTIKNLTLKNVTVEAEGDVGNKLGPTGAALVAENTNGGQIKSCAVTGTINAPGYEKGAAIAGMNTSGSKIENCYFEGKVTAKFMAGGMVSYNNGESSIENCFVNAELVNTATENGEGKDSQKGNNSGMLCAYPNGAVIQNNVSYGGSVTYAYPGETTGYYGRILGYTGNSCTLAKNYANSEMVINGEKVSGTADDANGKDVAAADLQNQSTYEELGWNFASIWRMDEELQHPVLQYYDNTDLPDRVTVTFNGDAKTRKGFTWYTQKPASDPVVRIGTDRTLEEAKEVKAKTEAIGLETKNQVVAEDLKADTTYYYQVGDSATERYSGIGSFKTAPEGGRFSFINITDTEASSQLWYDRAAINMARAFEPYPNAAFIMHSGDVVKNSADEETWKTFLNTAQGTLMNTTIAPAAGDCDAEENAFVNHFNLEANGDVTKGSYYSFDYSNTHFAVLNTNEDEANGVSQAQIDWLKKDVKDARDNGAKWVILNLHKGPYTTSNHMDDQDIKNLRRTLIPVITELSIDLVLQGHDHMLSCTKTLLYDETGEECAKPEEGTRFVEVKGGKKFEYFVSDQGTMYMLSNTGGEIHQEQNKNPEEISMDDYLNLFIRSEQGWGLYGNSQFQVTYFTGITIDDDKLEAMFYEIRPNQDPLGIAGVGIDKKVTQIEAMIDNLPSAETVKETDKAEVKAARKAYDLLSIAQQSAVRNIDKLSALEEKLLEIAAGDRKTAVWFDEAAEARQTIAIRNDSKEPFSNVPVLVRLKGVPADAPQDTVKCYTENGLPIPCEIENWDPKGTTTIWVKLPSIPANGAANIWVYYGGNKRELDDTEVWKGDYVLVEHFSQETKAGETRKDSTGTQTGSVVGKDLTAESDQDGMKVNRFDETKIVYGDIGGRQDQTSVSAIYCATQDDMDAMNANKGMFFAKALEGGHSRNSLWLGLDKKDKKLLGLYRGRREADDGVMQELKATSDLPMDGKPHLITIQNDSMTATLYVDGEIKSTIFLELNTSLPHPDIPATIGAFSDVEGIKSPFKGTLNEIQVSAQGTYPEWEKFRYNNFFGDAVVSGELEKKTDDEMKLLISYPCSGSSRPSGIVEVSGIVTKECKITAKASGKTYDCGTAKAGKYTVEVPVVGLEEQEIVLTATGIKNTKEQAKASVKLNVSDTKAPEQPVLTDGSKDGIVKGTKTDLTATPVTDYPENLTAAFYQRGGSVALNGDNTVMRVGTTKEQLPDSVQPTDGTVSEKLFDTVTAKDETPYQIYEVTLNEEQQKAENFHMVWNGTAERQVTSYVYNYEKAVWETTGSVYDQDAKSVSIDMQIKNENVIKDGKLTVLIWRGMTRPIEKREGYTPTEGEFDFGITMIPDPQIMTHGYRQAMIDHYQSVADHAKENKTKFLANVGDLCNRYFITQEYQWQTASMATERLEEAKIPYAIGWGNHDYDYNNNGQIMYNKYFSKERLEKGSQGTFGGSYGRNPKAQIDDVYYLLETNGVKLMVVSMGNYMNGDDRAWARQVIQEHPDYSVVIVTHSYLYGDNVSNGGLKRDVVDQCPNVKLVLCGHVGGPHINNTNGVWSLLENYSGNPYSEVGYLKNLKFDVENDLMYVNTYCTMNGSTMTDGIGKYNKSNVYEKNKEEFAVKLDLGGDITRTLTTSSLTLAAGGAELVGKPQKIAGNETAKVNLRGLEAGNTYEWYAVLTDDAGNETVSPTQYFTVEREGETVDKSDLDNLIKYAQSQQEKEEYQYVVPAVRNAFEKALAEAVAMNEKADATQAEVNAAYDKLLEMVQYLDYTGNSESLKTLVDAADGMNLDIYTPETRQALENALKTAKEVLANENSLQQEIDAARDALQAAMNELERIPINKAKLQKLVDDSKKYEDTIDQYTPATAKMFTDVLADARAVLGDVDATQAEVDAAYAALQNAVFGLRLIPDKSKLEDLISCAEKTDLTKYTKKSAAPFEVALQSAKEVLADENATNEDVKNAEKELENAQKNLVAKADSNEGKDNSNGNGNNNGSNNNGNNDSNSNEKGSEQPKTGDTSQILFYMMLLAVAGSIAVLSFRRKRR